MLQLAPVLKNTLVATTQVNDLVFTFTGQENLSLTLEGLGGTPATEYQGWIL